MFRVPHLLALIAMLSFSCGEDEEGDGVGTSALGLFEESLAETRAGVAGEAPAETESEVERADRAEREHAPSARELAASRYRCVAPAIPIPRPRDCVRGRSYPDCKWQMPHATLSGGRYRRWRNTIMEHWWGRPGLVSYLLASADDFHRLVPDQVLAIGDLDAPGPRHRTHDNGVDYDIYLPGALMVENAGGGRYPSNYEGKSAEEVAQLRERVLELAKILTYCAGGQIRIYYNDPPVLEAYLAWYDSMEFGENRYGAPMRIHNELHNFHIHATIPEELEIEMLPLVDGEHPIIRIEPPPPPESAAHLSSRTRPDFEAQNGSEDGENGSESD